MVQRSWMLCSASTSIILRFPLDQALSRACVSGGIDRPGGERRQRFEIVLLVQWDALVAPWGRAGRRIEPDIRVGVDLEDLRAPADDSEIHSPIFDASEVKYAAHLLAKRVRL